MSVPSTTIIDPIRPPGTGHQPAASPPASPTSRPHTPAWPGPCRRDRSPASAPRGAPRLSLFGAGPQRRNPQRQEPAHGQPLRRGPLGSEPVRRRSVPRRPHRSDTSRPARPRGGDLLRSQATIWGRYREDVIKLSILLGRGCHRLNPSEGTSPRPTIPIPAYQPDLPGHRPLPTRWFRGSGVSQPDPARWSSRPPTGAGWKAAARDARNAPAPPRTVHAGVIESFDTIGDRSVVAGKRECSHGGDARGRAGERGGPRSQ